jgi:hypothetical protein
MKEPIVEKGRTPAVPPAPAKTTLSIEARCPLCGNTIMSVTRGGRVMAEDLHPVPMHKRGGSGEGYMLCDDCGVLAELPSDLSMN